MPYAFRSLLKSPGFSLAVILTLALGIGANTAVFSVLRGVLLRPLPHRDGERLMYLRQSAPDAGLQNVNFSVPEIIEYQTQASKLTGFAQYSSMPFNLLGGEQPVQVKAGIVTGNYFDIMGLGALLGRTFNVNDDGAQAAPVIMLTEEYWRHAFGGDPKVVGRVLNINGRPATVVGVARSAPRFPDENEVFVNMVTSPHHMDATMVHGWTHRMTEVFARLAPGATLPEAQAELDGISARLHRDHPEVYEQAAGYQVAVRPLRDALTARATKTIYLLAAVAALVLLTACANVANLVLTRNLQRERELTVRWALGATRPQLRRLLLAETGILAVSGALLGLVFAYLGLGLLVGFAGRFTPRASEIHIDAGVLAFALVAATGAALLFAFMPSLRSPESSGATFTKTGSRATGPGQKLQRVLVVAQVAATVTVLSAAGLLARTLMRLYQVDTGVNLENTLTLEAPIGYGTGSPVQDRLLQEQMKARLAELPGVTAVGVGSNVPLRTAGALLEVKAEGRADEPGVPKPMAEYRIATPDYFKAAGMPVLKGRDFAATDQGDGGRVVILNQVLAERLFPNQDPIGRRVAWTGDVLRFIGVKDDWRTVVGVVGNTRDAGVDEAAPPVIFQPFTQNDMSWYPGGFIIRGPAAPGLGAQAARVIRELAPDQPIEHIATLEQVREATLAPQRLNAFLVGALGSLALIIAAVGIAGVLAFFVSQRTNEIGIRMSLGADPASIMQMVLGDGTKLLVYGVVLGLATSIVVARLLQGLLFGVAPRDPTTLVVVSLTMVAVGLGACAIPAFRAARVDPLVAMRAE